MSTPVSHNEKELLQQVAQGDISAYKQLYNHYWDQIYSTALMFTKTPELSEDLAQDVFARIWISREKLAEVENFKSYLFIIARNIFYNSLRSKVYTTSIESYFEQYFGDPSVVPANKAELKELEELIEQGIRNLPPQQQKAFRLSRFKGLKHEQIAAEMGISKFSVKSHIVRAIAALRRHLEDHQDKLQVIIWVLLFL